jgi:SHS2 domain-containing protein
VIDHCRKGLCAGAGVRYNAAVTEQCSTGFEIFAVTADKGIRAWGRDLPEVFVNAAQGLWSLMVEPGAVRPLQAYPVRVEASDRETLLVAWLNELLFLHEAEHVALSRFRVKRLSEECLEAVAEGEPLDRARHAPVGHVKAVTYHLLQIRPAGAGWVAQVVVDV